MARPIVTCGAKIVLAWNASSGVYDASLSASATGTPDQWEWTILSVPPGLEALLSGTWGDFTDGMALIQNPSLDDIPTDTVAGTIVARCRAHNADGWSDPSQDRETGQQPIVIKSESLDLEIPGDYQYDWGEGQLNSALRKIDALLASKRLLTRSPKLVNLATITAAKAAGSITVVAKASLANGEEVVVPDGDHDAVRFIFDASGSYTPAGGYDTTHVRVDVSTLTTAEEVRDALWTAIVASADAGDLNITATQAVATDEIDLENFASGTFGNIAITETVSNAGFSVTGMSGGAGDLVVLSVSGGEAPTEPAAVGAVTTPGAVVALNASFGSLSLAVVAGRNAIQPANMVLIRDAATDDPVLWEGKTVYGLLHCESSVDGHTFNDTTAQVAITFVREIDSTTHELGYVKGEAVDGLALNYSYVVRAAFASLAESAFLDGGFTDLMEGGGSDWTLVSIGTETYAAAVDELVMVENGSTATITLPAVTTGRIAVKCIGASTVTMRADGTETIAWDMDQTEITMNPGMYYGRSVVLVGDPDRDRWVVIADCEGGVE